MEAILTVSSYTAGTADEGIRLYTFDSQSGIFTHRNTIVNDKNPSFIAFSADRRFAYVCQELPGEASVRAYLLEDKGFSWVPMNEISVPGCGMCHVAVSPQGKYLLCSNFTTGNIASCRILEDGSLGSVMCTVQMHGSSLRTDWFQDRSRCHQVVFAPDGELMVAADMGGDRLRLYDFDENSGEIRPHPAQRQLVCDPGDGPRHHCFSQDGRMLYSVAEIEAAVTAYRYDRESGTFARVQKVSTVPGDFAGWRTASEIALSKNNRYAFIANRGFDTIARFEILPDGRLTETPAYFDSFGEETRMFCLTPDERFVVIANQKSNRLSSCRYDPETGFIAQRVCTQRVHQPAFVDVHRL